jgi:hypothetical protein
MVPGKRLRDGDISQEWQQKSMGLVIQPSLDICRMLSALASTDTVRNHQRICPSIAVSKCTIHHLQHCPSRLAQGLSAAVILV